MEHETEQPEEGSVDYESRIAGHFGVPDDPEEEEAEQPETESEEPEPESAEPEFAEVEYEGATYKVPPVLKDALMRNADYTRKTQELADRNRQIELHQQQIKAAQLEQQFNQSVADEFKRVQQIESTLEQFKSQVDWDKLSTDEMIRYKHQMDVLREQREEAVRAIEGKRGEWLESMKKAHEEYLERGREYLKKSIPQWSPEVAKGLSEYALSEGFTSEEVAGLADPRLVRTLWKARQYDDLQKKAVAQKDKPAPVVKPSASNPMPQHVKQKLNFRKQIKSAKSESDKANLIQSRLGEMFGG